MSAPTIPELRLQTLFYIERARQLGSLLPMERPIEPDESRAFRAELLTALAKCNQLHTMVCGEKPPAVGP